MATSIFMRINSSGPATQLIADMGVVLDKTITDNEFVTELELLKVKNSADLVTLVSDDAYGADSSTILLSATDNGTAYTNDEALRAIERAGAEVKLQNWFGGWS